MKKTLVKVKNRFERRILDQIEGSGRAVQYEGTRIPYILAGHYIPDYVIDTPTGRLYIEAKGYFRPEAKRKMVAVKRQHPELDIRIVFYRNKSIKKNLQYERWAKKVGYKYAFDAIPGDWLDGY